MIWHFSCHGLATVPTRDSKKNVLSETLLKVHLGTLRNTLQVKLSWKWNFYWFSLGHNNQTLSKLSSCSLCVLVLECVCTLKSLFSSYTGKNHNPVSLLAWNCFMKIVCVFVTNYWCIMGLCPEHNFSQGMSCVQLRESQVELGTQVPPGDGVLDFCRC